tara:strand:+ start:28279 stop:28416 length:138 start_codon:yes stop_codon:yes gene_type:complete
MVLLKALPFLQIVIFGKAGTLAISNISTIIALEAPRFSWRPVGLS